MPGHALGGVLQSSKTPERSLEVLGQPFVALDPLPGQRMQEGDVPRMQEGPIQADLAGKVPDAAVGPIPQDRVAMADRCTRI